MTFSITLDEEQYSALIVGLCYSIVKLENNKLAQEIDTLMNYITSNIEKDLTTEAKL